MGAQRDRVRRLKTFGALLTLGAVVSCAPGAAGLDPTQSASSPADAGSTEPATSEPGGPTAAPSGPAQGGRGAAPGDTVASQCSILITGVRPDTTLVGYRYEKGQIDWQAAGQIGWIPQTMTTVVDLEDASPLYWAIRPDGMLYRITVTTDDGGVRVLATKVAAGWGEVRVLAAGSPTGDTGATYLYGLTVDGGLKRYVTSDDGQRLLSSGTIAEDGWAGVRTLSFDRVAEMGPRNKPREADVMLAVTRSGHLAEFTFPRHAPDQWTRTDLRSSTWDAFTTVASGFCDTERPSRPIVALTPGGEVYLYVDQHGSDRSGADLGRGVKVASWPEVTFYNQ